MKTLSLERIAEKCQRERHEGTLPAHPRQLEMLCFLQWLSTQPGGLSGMLGEFARTLGEDGEAELPGSEGYYDVFGTRPDAQDFRADDRWVSIAESNRFNRLNLDWERNHPAHQGAASFAAYLADWASPGADNAAWRKFCPSFLDWLGGYMDRHAKSAMARTADTAQRRWLLDILDLAWRSGVPQPIVGDSRQGKTVSLKTHAEAWPGQARLVRCPLSNRERDFIEAHALAYGMEFTPHTPIGALRSRVAFVTRNVRLMLLYDEAHALVPLKYSRGTPPPRLEWVRDNVMDQDIPCAFLATPQNHKETLAEYKDRSGYNLDQWNLRMGKVQILKVEADANDLRAVAKVHFLGLSESGLAELCDAAEESGNPMQFLPIAGRYARAIADRRGADGISLADVRAAAALAGAALPDSETLPPPKKPARGSVRGLSAEPLHVPRRGVAPVSQDADCVMA